MTDTQRATWFVVLVLLVGLLCIVLAGCGARELAAHRNAMILDAAVSIYTCGIEIETLASEVASDEALPEDTREAVSAVAEKAQEVQVAVRDISERTMVAQALSGPPKEEIARGSEKDSYLFNADAGAAHATTRRRQILKALPGKIADFTATVVEKASRRLWDRLPVMAQIMLILGVALWGWRRLRQQDGVIVRMLERSSMASEDKRYVSENTPVQKRYRKKRRG